jgi:N-acetylmuramic acid 6-phosphate etherase
MAPEGVVRLVLGQEAAGVRAAQGGWRRWARWARAIARRVGGGGRWILAGAGTSGRLCAQQAAEVVPTFGISPRRVIALVAGGTRALRRSVEGAEDDARAGAAAVRRLRVGRRDAVLGVSASGRTPFVRAALREARRRGAWTAMLTGRVLGTGPEVLAGSTRMKAGTATKAVLDALSTAVFVSLGGAYGPWMVGVRPVSGKLRRRARRIVAEAGEVSEERARRLLRAAGGDVRLAVVMARAGVDARAARRRLARSGGSVRRAIEGAGS